MARLDGSGAQQLTDFENRSIHPRWSPDGSRFVFASNMTGNFEIYVMNANGTNVNQLTRNSAGSWKPDWSPDGSKILFSGSDRDRTYHVYVMNSDGSNVTMLTPSDSYDDSAMWSPDGEYITFASRRDGTSGSRTNGKDQIWVMRADGTGQTRVTNELTATFKRPSWTP